MNKKTNYQQRFKMIILLLLLFGSPCKLEVWVELEVNTIAINAIIITLIRL